MTITFTVGLWLAPFALLALFFVIGAGIEAISATDATIAWVLLSVLMLMARFLP